LKGSNMSETVTLAACLAQLPARDLARYRAVLAGIAAEERRVGRYATAVWFSVLGDACAAEQRRRAGSGVDAELPDTEAALRVVARSLPDGDVAALLTQYRALAGVQPRTPSIAALTRLAASCATLLDEAMTCRGTLQAQLPQPAPVTRSPASHAGWRPSPTGRPAAGSITFARLSRAERRDNRA
jgi:hypothetical protein